MIAVRLTLERRRFCRTQIHKRLQAESYTPRSWRTHPLHICPREPYAPDDPSTRACLDWIFLISSLNFSFWSEREGCPDRYGVEWREGWGLEERKVHTGYWSLVAAVDRGACAELYAKGVDEADRIGQRSRRVSPSRMQHSTRRRSFVRIRSSTMSFGEHPNAVRAYRCASTASL